MPVHAILNQDRVISYRGIAQTVPDTLEYLPHYLILHLGMPAEAKGGIGYPHHPGCLQERRRQVGTGIAAILIDPTHGPHPCAHYALQRLSTTPA